MNFSRMSLSCQARHCVKTLNIGDIFSIHVNARGCRVGAANHHQRRSEKLGLRGVMDECLLQLGPSLRHLPLSDVTQMDVRVFMNTTS